MAVKLFAVALPVILTAPNVVFPPELVEVRASHANAFDSPSVGHTFNVAVEESYQIWPASGFDGGVVFFKSIHQLETKIHRRRKVWQLAC